MIQIVGRKSFKEINIISVQKVDGITSSLCGETSDKQEFAARTIRPKYIKKIEAFLTDFPKMKSNKNNNAHFVNECIKNTNWDKIKKR